MPMNVRWLSQKNWLCRKKNLFLHSSKIMCNFKIKALPSWWARRWSLSSEAPFRPEKGSGKTHLNQEASAKGSHSAFPCGLYQSESREMASSHISVAGILLMKLVIMLRELKGQVRRGMWGNPEIRCNWKPLPPVRWKDRIRGDSPEELGTWRKVSEQFRPQEKRVCCWGCSPKQSVRKTPLFLPPNFMPMPTLGTI